MGSLEIIPLYFIALFLFLLPGAAVTLIVTARRKLSRIQALTLTVTASAAFGYAAFWVYFGNKYFGEAFSYTVLLLSACVVVNGLRDPQARAVIRSIMSPGAYVLIAGICYLCFFSLFGNPLQARVDLANVRFFDDVRPGDNLIPFIFAERIYDKQPLKPFCCGDWLSSDRPPLQAGIFLLQRPVRALGNTGLQYQTLGTALQCIWIWGIWALLTSLRTHPQRIRQALGFLIFSGFLFYNSVYVWPKLFGAGLMLLAASVVLEAFINKRALTSFDSALAAASIALAMLAHPGTAFSLPALAALLLWKKRDFSLRPVLFAAATIALFVAPWIAYQKLYDPPGNRLLKMHLAGVGGIDSRSVRQAIEDAYTSRSAATLLQYKWTNVAGLIGSEPVRGFGLNTDARVAQREYIWNAIGVLNAGWLVIAGLLVLRKRRAAVPGSAWLIAAALLNFAVWCVILFGPRATTTTHSSYADILLLSLGLIGFLLILPRIVVLVLFAIQVLNFAWTWVLFIPVAVPTSITSSTAPELQWPMLIAGAICAAGLIWHFGVSYSHRDATETVALGSETPRVDSGIMF